MKNILFNISLLLLVLSVISADPTQLTYFSQHEVQHESDYIEIGIVVHCEDAILGNAVKKAKDIVTHLQKIVIDYCKQKTKKKPECDDAFEASKHQIKPKYQLVRKVQTFIAFMVDHEITIKIRNLQGIGKMTDKLLIAGEGYITINGFEWKAENQQNPQKQALKNGMKDGEQTCGRMKLKLSRIISVEEVDEAEQQKQQEQQEQGEQGEQEQQQEQQDAEIIVFKFEVECR